jgi:peptidoglycan/LPS O-acetylase OafA/YrhL
MKLGSGGIVAKAKRPDIQVLRGIAVLVVVLSHFEVPHINGGFLGVDVFFVISGYVITQTLLQSSNAASSTKQRIKHFYVRRAKRILPAATFIALISFFASIFFFPISYLGRHLTEVIGSIFMFSNGVFWHQSLFYLNQTTVPSPFLHYWSLAVEEQFYLVWPLVLILIVKNRKWIVYLGIPILFALAVVTTHSRPSFSYFSPSSRAWEFLLGAAVIFLPKKKFANWVRSLFIAAASLALVASFLIISHRNATPGLSTTIPVLSTAILIYLGFNSTVLRPLQWIGDISYSLYLVHWPVIVFFNALYIHKSSAATFALIVLSIALAKLISMAIESPFRFETLGIARRKAFISSAAGVAAVLLLASANGYFSKQDVTTLVMDPGHSELYYSTCHTQGSMPIVKGCYFADTTSDKTVMLVGDSHAAQYFTGLEVAAKAAGYKLLSTTKSACPAVLFVKYASSEDESCNEWQHNIVDVVKQVQPDILVISNFTERTGDRFSLGVSPKEFADSQVEFINRVRGSVGKVAYVGDSPFPGLYAMTCLENNRKHLSRCDLRDTKTATSNAVEKRVSEIGVTVVDSRGFLCQKGICPAVVGEKNVYRDASHISNHIYDIVAKGLAPIFD